MHVIPHNHNRLGWVGQGPEVEALERELAREFRPGDDCAVVSSGTAAIHLAVKALRWREREIVIPTYACTAIYNAVDCIEYNAVNKPLRVELTDVCGDTFNAMGSDITVDTYGCPTTPGIIHDFTHSVGGTYLGKPTGAGGDLSVISFGATKPLGVGQGGAVLGPKEYINRIKHERDQDGVVGGFNWQLSDVMAKMVRERLKYLLEENDWRALVARTYHGAHPGSGPIWTLGRTFYRYVISVPHWRKAQAHFSARGIETINPLHPDELLHRKLGQNPKNYPNAEEIACTTLSLPIWPGMTDDEVNRVAEALSEWRV